MELWESINSKQKELERAIEELKTQGENLAGAERNYKVALSKKVLERRNNKISMSEINLTIYGDEAIAELRFKRDVANSVYEATKEKINILKIQLKILVEIYKQEYGQVR